MRHTFSIYNHNPLWNWMAADVDDFFADAVPRRELSRSVPYSVKEGEDAFMMTMDLPGFRKEDLKLEVVDQTLTVSGERKRSGEGEGQKVFWQFAIPVGADSAKVAANLQDGVLEIAFPKAEEAKPRSVEIQSSSSGIFSKLIGNVAKKDHAGQ